MTTTIRQFKIYDGIFDPEVPIDMSPDIPTVEGNLIVMLWLAQTDAYIDVQPYSPAQLIPVEGINSMAGYGRTKASMIEYAAGVFLGPTQPMIENYHVLGGVSQALTNVPFQVVLYELTSDLGPLVSWASYSIDSPYSVEVRDWLAVPSGYSKPRPVLAFAMTPPGEDPPVLVGADSDDGFSISNNPIDNFRVRLGDVAWGMNESRTFSIAEPGFVGYISGVTEQSRHSNVQHIQKDSGTIVPATDGVPVTAKNLLVLSARYKNFAGPFDMAGWNSLRKTSAENPDQLTVVTWWKQATLSEPSSYTVPGSPLNLDLREVSGFTEEVGLAVYAYFDSTADPSEFSGEWTPAKMYAYRHSFGVAVPVGNFPDNDAYFYSVVGFALPQDWAYNLPDPMVHEDQVLLASGEGWDFYPDGFFGAPITGGSSSGFNTSIDFEAGWTLPELERQAVVVGAIFINGPTPATQINELVWLKQLDPNLNFDWHGPAWSRYLALSPRIQALIDLQMQITTLEQSIATLQTAITQFGADTTVIADEQASRDTRIDSLENP